MAGRYRGGGTAFPAACAASIHAAFARSTSASAASAVPPERRARFQVRNVGDVAAVLVAVKDVDVVIAHLFFPQLEIIAFDQPQELPYLLGLRFTPNLPAGSEAPGCRSA